MVNDVKCPWCTRTYAHEHHADDLKIVASMGLLGRYAAFGNTLGRIAALNCPCPGSNENPQRHAVFCAVGMAQFAIRSFMSSPETEAACGNLVAMALDRCMQWAEHCGDCEEGAGQCQECRNHWLAASSSLMLVKAVPDVVPPHIPRPVKDGKLWLVGSSQPDDDRVNGLIQWIDQRPGDVVFAMYAEGGRMTQAKVWRVAEGGGPAGPDGNEILTSASAVLDNPQAWERLLSHGARPAQLRTHEDAEIFLRNWHDRMAVEDASGLAAAKARGIIHGLKLCGLLSGDEAEAWTARVEKCPEDGLHGGGCSWCNFCGNVCRLCGLTMKDGKACLDEECLRRRADLEKSYETLGPGDMPG